MTECWTINLDLAVTPLDDGLEALPPPVRLSSDSDVSPLSPPGLPQLSTGAESPLHAIYTTQLITVQPDGSEWTTESSSLHTSSGTQQQENS